MLEKGENMEIFNNDNYKFISNYVEQKLPILKENQNFKKEYLRLTDAMEELEQTPDGSICTIVSDNGFLMVSPASFHPGPPLPKRFRGPYIFSVQNG